MINSDFKSIEDLLLSFPDEQSCIEHLKDLRWPDKVKSPFDENSKVYLCKNNRYRCRNTTKYFNVRTNTLFYNSNISLQKWFIGIWLIQQKKGLLSSVELADNLKISQKSAWFMIQNIKSFIKIENTQEEAILNQKIRNENTEILNENEKFQMSDWLKILKK